MRFAQECLKGLNRKRHCSLWSQRLTIRKNKRMNSQTKYIPGIDTLKAFGLWLMVLGHAHLVDDTLRTAIYTFHMPLFFVISGYLFKYRDLKEQIAKSWKGIMVPYLLVNAICLAISLISTIRNGELSLTLVWNKVLPICTGLGYGMGAYEPVCTPMWFFYVMFFLQILVNLVGRQTQHCLIFTLGSLALCILMNYKGIDTLVPIDSLLMAVPFFYLGIWLKTILQKVNIDNRIIKVTIPLILLPFGLMIGMYNGRIDMDLFQFGNSVFLFYISAMITCSALIFASLQIGGGKIVRLISVGAPIIVGFNLLTISYIKVLVNHLFTGEWNNFIGLAVSIIVISILILVTVFCRTFIPSILGYRQ